MADLIIKTYLATFIATAGNLKLFRLREVIIPYFSFVQCLFHLSVLGGGFVENVCYIVLSTDSRRIGGGLGVGKIITGFVARLYISCWWLICRINLLVTAIFILGTNGDLVFISATHSPSRVLDLFNMPVIRSNHLRHQPPTKKVVPNYKSERAKITTE